jgi:hypothetical protein
MSLLPFCIGFLLIALAQFVEVLCYKLGGSAFESRLGRTMALGLSQPLTQMSKAQQKREADDFSAICEPIV